MDDGAQVDGTKRQIHRERTSEKLVRVDASKSRSWGEYGAEIGLGETQGRDCLQNSKFSHLEV